jgi:hypothetical protein
MMNHRRSPQLRIVPLAAIILAALALAGCSKKINTVDPSYVSPEGQPEASAQQIAYPELPVTVYYMKRALATCEDCPDTLISTNPVYPTGPGFINGMIFDGTAASRYQILRRESNGGYAPLYDYSVNPSQRFAQSGWKLFTWQDGRPSGFDPPTYLGRGVVSGVVTPTTPLTNTSSGQAVDVQDISLTTDSLVTITLKAPVAGAVGYVLQVYAVPNSYVSAAIHNAAPAPYSTQDHRDYLVQWLPVSEGGTIDYARVKTLSRIPYIPGAPYRMRMSAVDAQGRLVGFSYGDTLLADGPDEGYYRKFQAGAFFADAAINPSGGSAPTRVKFDAGTQAASPRSRTISLGQARSRPPGR